MVTPSSIAPDMIYLTHIVIIWEKILPVSGHNFYFYRILNNENFKVKVEQTNFVTHLIITAVLDPDLEIRWGALIQTLT